MDQDMLERALLMACAAAHHPGEHHVILVDSGLQEIYPQSNRILARDGFVPVDGPVLPGLYGFVLFGHPGLPPVPTVPELRTYCTHYAGLTAYVYCVKDGSLREFSPAELDELAAGIYVGGE